MELIYADKNRTALGQLSSFDMDYDATGDKNFELVVDDYIVDKNGWVFIPNTEIGGIVDSITVNTKDHTVKYVGRNFRGILNDKIMKVPTGQNYISVQGNLDDAINSFLVEYGLDSCFTCLIPQTENVDYTVDYAFAPFCTLYDGIVGLANSINFKLLFSYNAQTNKVEIIPRLIENFTDFLTYTKNSSVNLEIQDNAMAVNHFVLVGYDEADRYQIDIFVNENSQIMDYAEVLEPIKDSQYILDSRNQQLFGIDEKTQLQITDKITPVENYEYLSEKPADWTTNFSSYYYQKIEEDGAEVNISYEPFELVPYYATLINQPDDWSWNYKNYYQLVDGVYQNFDSVITESVTYKKVKKKPKDWKTNYSDYFYKFNNGLVDEYRSIEGINKDYYKKQIFRPTDWTNHWDNYYQVVTLFNRITGEYTTTYEKAGTTFYPSNNQTTGWKKVSSKKAPKWEKQKYYTKLTKTYAPKFSAQVVYAKVTTQTESAPPFLSGQAYKLTEIPPTFSGCYRMVYDHYKGMISKLLENLEIYPINKQEVAITDFEANIGDVVGGYDDKTNITLVAPILNIIYRIERGIQRSIEYVLGG